MPCGDEDSPTHSCPHKTFPSPRSIAHKFNKFLTQLFSKQERIIFILTTLNGRIKDDMFYVHQRNVQISKVSPMVIIYTLVHYKFGNQFSFSIHKSKDDTAVASQTLRAEGNLRDHKLKPSLCRWELHSPSLDSLSISGQICSVFLS